MTTWDQKEFDKFYAALPPERRAADEKVLSDLFNEATLRAPLLAQELEWAKAHGVRFMVDYNDGKYGGYYQDGTGVVAISKKHTQHTEIALGILAHEIRHAWQDEQGLLPNIQKQDFLAYYMTLGLIEADASAFQEATERQYADISWEGMERLRSPDSHSTLRMEFNDWYYQRAATYGNRAMRDYACMIGIEGVEPVDINCEFRLSAPPAPRRPSGMTLQKELAALSRDFSGKEYFNAAARGRPWGPSLYRILDPTLALRFYREKSEPDDIVRKICTKQKIGV